MTEEKTKESDVGPYSFSGTFEEAKMGEIFIVEENKEYIPYMKIKSIVTNTGQIYNAVNIQKGIPAYFIPLKDVFLKTKYM